MQIREKGKQVLCIKTEYVPEKKRTIGRTVAKQEKYLSTVSEEVRQQLSKEDVDSLQKWLSEREKTKSVEWQEQSLSILAGVLERSAIALDNDAELSDRTAQTILENVDRLKKSLRKRGFKKEKEQPKKAAVDSNQGSLLS